MDVNYSISSNCNPLQPYDNRNQVTRTNNIGKNIAVTIFVGTVLLITPFSDLHGDVKLISDYSPSTHIDYVSIDGSKEIDCLKNSLFLDLLKIENLKKLDCISLFRENWNGVGGRAFSGTSIRIFRDIIENVCKQPSIAPTGRNSLLLQYELDDHSILAFEVREKRVEMVYVKRGDYSSAISKVFTDDFIRNINSQVARFYGLKQN